MKRKNEMVEKELFSSEELKRECENKICILEELIAKAKSNLVGSEMREEYASLIAVVLRTLTCKTSGTEGLLKQVDYSSKMLFPLYSPIDALNLLVSYRLVNIVCNKDQAMLRVLDDLTDTNRVYTTYLTFDSWLFEAVIDFKDKDYPPLSRYELIRLIADKRGAHFQPEIDGRLYKITHESILPIVFEGKYSADNLYTETIIGIADELCFSYRHTLGSNPQVIKEEGFVYIQEYVNIPQNTLKYVRSLLPINAYNSNNHYDCIVKEKACIIYEIAFRERFFEIAIIDIS